MLLCSGPSLISKFIDLLKYRPTGSLYARRPALPMHKVYESSQRRKQRYTKRPTTVSAAVFDWLTNAVMKC